MPYHQRSRQCPKSSSLSWKTSFCLKLLSYVIPEFSWGMTSYWSQTSCRLERVHFLSSGRDKHPDLSFPEVGKTFYLVHQRRNNGWFISNILCKCACFSGEDVTLCNRLICSTDRLICSWECGSSLSPWFFKDLQLSSGFDPSWFLWPTDDLLISLCVQESWQTFT